MVLADRGAPTQDVLDRVADDLGIRTTFLRAAGRAERDDGVRGRLLIFDALAADDTRTGRDDGSGGLTWLAPGGRTALDLPDALRGAVDGWAAEHAGGTIPVERPAWSRPGGLADLVDWVGARLDALGIRPTAPPQIVQLWGISVVLKQPTDHGTYFGKAVDRVFASEPVVTRALAARTPGVFPEIVAIDAGAGRMLMADARFRPFEELDPERGALGLRALARVQRAWIGDTSMLAGLGCPDRGPFVLAGQLAGVLGELGGPGGRADATEGTGLTDAELARLDEVLPAIGALCDQAAADPVPTTLLHGDCHPGNAGLRHDGTVCLLDWSDAAIGHPFLDVEVWVGRAPEEVRPMLRRAYLSEWPEVPHAERVLAVADVLSAAYQVVTSWQLQGGVEPDERPAFAAGVAAWARRLLELHGRLGV
jgi:hypothetical protein